MLTCYRVQVTGKWHLLARFQCDIAQPCVTPAFFLPSIEMEEEKARNISFLLYELAGLFFSHLPRIIILQFPHVDRKVIIKENNLGRAAW